MLEKSTLHSCPSLPIPQGISPVSTTSFLTPLARSSHMTTPLLGRQVSVDRLPVYSVCKEWKGPHCILLSLHCAPGSVPESGTRPSVNELPGKNCHPLRSTAIIILNPGHPNTEHKSPLMGKTNVGTSICDVGLWTVTPAL